MNLDTEFGDGTLKLKLEGELDHHAAKRAAATVEEYIDTFLPRRCVVDFGGVTFMDSSGIALLIKVRRLIGEIGGAMDVENVRKQPMRVLHAAGVDAMMGLAAHAAGEVNT